MNGKHAKSLHIWICAKLEKLAQVYLCMHLLFQFQFE